MDQQKIGKFIAECRKRCMDFAWFLGYGEFVNHTAKELPVMKRKLVLLLAVTMVLTGCSAAQPEKQTPNASLGESETISPETEYTVFPTETDSTLIP